MTTITMDELPRDNGAFWNSFKALEPISGELRGEYLVRLSKAFEDYANEWFKTAGEIMAGTYGRDWPTHYTR